ncbi:MAG: hypothetical protein PHW40_07310 [Candidatus Izemoplasmatales bacterium]|nr:hypothetical protein [Candidatus Izemoplasmatales bacterium]
MDSEFIYRFMSFESFVNVVLTKKLTFSSPYKWDDPMEVHLLNVFTSNVLLEPDIEKKPIKAMLLGHLLQTFLLSFSKLPESDALWKIYGTPNHNSIRIKVCALSTKRLPNTVLKNVTYLPNDTFIQTCIKSTGHDPFKMYALKREAFQHEREYRLLLLHNPKKDELAGFASACMAATGVLSLESYANPLKVRKSTDPPEPTLPLTESKKGNSMMKYLGLLILIIDI